MRNCPGRLRRACIPLAALLCAAITVRAQFTFDIGLGVTHLDPRYTFRSYDTTVSESVSLWTVTLIRDMPAIHFGHDGAIGIMYGFHFGYGDKTGMGALSAIITGKYGADASDKTRSRFGVTFGAGEIAGGVSRDEETKTMLATVALIQGDWAVDPDSWHVLKLRLIKSFLTGSDVNEETGVISRFPMYQLSLAYEARY